MARRIGTENQTQNRDGAWVPAIPLPVMREGWRTIRLRCGHEGCSRRFWRMESYQAHYLFRHIMRYW